jgi:hypothetical protein
MYISYGYRNGHLIRGLIRAVKKVAVLVPQHSEFPAPYQSGYSRKLYSVSTLTRRQGMNVGQARFGDPAAHKVQAVQPFQSTRLAIAPDSF